MSAQNYQEMVNFYHNLTLYCAIAAVVFLAVAIFLFIKLRIPQVFGELTGRTAQKAINEMTSGGATSGTLASAKIGSDGRRQRKGLTGTLGTGGLRKNSNRGTGRLNTSSVTGNLATAPIEHPATKGNVISHSYKQQIAPIDSYGSAETDVLDTFGSGETDVLDSFGSTETSVLDSYGSAETDVLNSKQIVSEQGTEEIGETSRENVNDTMPMYQAPESETMVLSQDLKPVNVEFVVIRSIVEIHTEEVI